jgi:hypothetical protein
MKLLYNVTVKIIHERSITWLKWMKEKHIPNVLATGCFISARISKLKYMDETDGLTYSIQYLCENSSVIDNYNEKFAPLLQQEHQDLFKDQYLVFRTIM